MKFTKNIGMLLLGAWLIVHGLQTLVNFNFAGLDTIMAVVAIAAGVLILIGR
jgi:p-aminobenzoyl-glutamate transporter AbgT